MRVLLIATTISFVVWRFSRFCAKGAVAVRTGVALIVAVSGLCPAGTQIA
jgi:hypothetical protein